MNAPSPITPASLTARIRAFFVWLKAEFDRLRSRVW